MRSREAGSFNTWLFLVNLLLAILGAAVAVFAWSRHEMSVIRIESAVVLGLVALNLRHHARPN